MYAVNIKELEDSISQLTSTILNNYEELTPAQLGFEVSEQKMALLHHLGLSTDHISLSAWPLFFGSSLHQADSLKINLCATTFGALIIAQSEKDLSQYREKLTSVIRTLVLLRSDDGSWPSDVGLEYSSKKVTGTINQTTLALATLIKLGFFERVSPLTGETVANDILHKRLSFLQTSIDCLYHAGSENESDFAWYHTTDHLKNFNAGSVLATANVLNVVSKLLHLYEQVAPYGIMDVTKPTAQLERMRGKAYHWMLSVQNQDGSFSKNGYKAPSFSYTCMAVSAMLLCPEENEAQINKAMTFILDYQYSSLLEKEPGSEYYDTFTIIIEEGRYKRSVKNVHEIFTESIYVLALINYIHFLRSRSSKPLITLKIKYEIDRMLREILKRKCKGKTNYYIKGRRESAFQYPIYCIYYSIVSFRYYLEDCKNCKFPIKSIYIGIICAAVCIACLLYFICTRAIGSIIGAILSIPLGLLINFLSENKGRSA